MRPMFKALFCCVVAISHSVLSATADRPNIIYILSDDQGWGDASCYNVDSKVQTPGIDRLAKEGMRFTNAHSGASVCTPTRYGLLTGRYSWRTRLQARVLSSGDDPLIEKDVVTVPAFLKRNGYKTALIGKWHLGFLYEPDDGSRPIPVGTEIAQGPITRGFDEYQGFHHAREMETWIEQDKVTEIIDPVEMLPRITERSVEYIEARGKEQDQPFFLYVALNSPHTPILPSSEWKGKSGIGDYGDFVMQTDHAVVEILNALDAAGLAENTVVYFTADNGCSVKADLKDLASKGHDPMGGLKGMKASLDEGGHRVPYVVRWPGIIEAGSENDELICHNSLMATCAEMLDVPLADTEGVDSFSILPLLKGQATEGPTHPVVIHHSYAGDFGITSKHWKLQARKSRKTEELRLYNLEQDLGEKTNLFNAHPETVEGMMVKLKRAIEQGRTRPGPPLSNDVEVKLFKEKKGK